jgi:hypothetical protein
MQETPMSSLFHPRYFSTNGQKNKRWAYVILVAISLSTEHAYAGDHASETQRKTSGKGVPAWVVRECRPWTGAEILARIAGPGEWFYRETGDFCYLDTRPGVM